MAVVLETAADFEDEVMVPDVPELNEENRKASEDVDAEYGSISILTTDDNSYVVSPSVPASNQKLRRNDVIYDGVISGSDETPVTQDSPQRGSVDETTCFLGGTPVHSLV